MIFIKGTLTSISLVIAAVTAVVAYPAHQNLKKRQEDDDGEVSNGLTDVVSWDTYTLKVNGERLFLFSGEFHYYRLPSPGLWLDVLEKFKALGYNGVSFYFNWGYHSPKKGVYNFDGVRDVQRAFDAAEKTNLHVISRAGPYINAENDCGGFPSWLMNMQSPARKSNPENNANCEEWLTEIDKFLVPNQITNGGKIILNQLDNEYSANTDPAYLEMIKAKFIADGMIVPDIYNDANMLQNFPDGPADIYGWDNYPAGFDCSNPDAWPNNRSTEYMSYHASTNLNQPAVLWEFQGGAFDPWGGPGYEACYQMVNEKYAKVYYKNNYAQGITIQNLYMTYGGTSWGGLSKPTVYTSYDYGPFLTTEHFVPEVDKSDIILVDGRAATDASAKFYIAQHWLTSSKDLDEFHIIIDTTDGTFTIPRSSKLILNGRDAKLLVTDYDFNSQHLVYSTSEIFTHQDAGSHDVIIVYAYEKEEGEFAIKVKDDTKVKVETNNDSVKSETNDGILQLTYTHPNGTSPIYISGGAEKDLLVLVAGYQSALRWWAPYLNEKEGKRALINGPYLVRSATVSKDDKSTVAFTGDIDETTDIQVVLPDGIKAITWNGEKVHLKKEDKHDIYTGILEFKKPDIKYTDLTEVTWKYKAADRLSTASITPHDTWPILYADDYGYHTGSIWFRGTFNGSSEITGFNLTCHSGLASAWVVYLNSHYLGGFDVGNQAFTNLNGTLIDPEGENVISVLLWTTGHEEDGVSDDNYKQARGFTKAQLLGVSNQTIWSIDWKIQGNLGGEDLADPVRGPYNEGGLYGERNGWHLPGFPDNEWEDITIPENKNRTGVSWYRTTFDVIIPDGYEVPMSLRYVDDTKTRYRSLLFLNGWQLGRYANDLGPQTQFYLPKGILNTAGKNTLAIAVVAIDEAAQLGQVILEPYKTLQSAIPPVDLVASPGYDARQQ
ncbi:glycoside hydrolase superfamily [Phascolomyces articulosus]|uniref:beta-galactosidase n=1 Tax=Phascolomyces articulosus TaxID=60185 RepID=A0AAD5K9J1_9FUNG|nr:glycoside hydrolase superfamily [Phascolomyces articulosus]